VLNVIRYHAKMANLDWLLHPPIPASVRVEACREPRVANVFAAFYLLGDCVYSQESQWFLRGVQKAIIQHALMLKFWIGQTSADLYWNNARFDQLLSWQKNVSLNKEELELLQNFTNDTTKLIRNAENNDFARNL